MLRRSILNFLLATPLGRFLAGVISTIAAFTVIYLDNSVDVPRLKKDTAVRLPHPRLRGRVSVEEALANRRSVREYVDEPLTLEEVSQLLWAAYGISEVTHGLRTAPSAGAQYPLEVYIAVREGGVKTIDGFLPAGVYYYDPHSHTLHVVRRGDVSSELYHAALEQQWVLEAPVSIVFTAVYSRTVRVYGERGRVRYVPMDLGHAAQNVYLQATALGLGTVAVGAFYDEDVRKILELPERETPIYIMPVGRPAVRYELTERELAQYIEKKRSKLSN